MPQGPFQSVIAKNPSGVAVNLATDADNSLYVAPLAQNLVKNITAATVISALPVYVARVIVITAGSTAGTINDCTTTAAAAVANQIGTAPTTVGSYNIDVQGTSGLVVVPGTGQVLVVSYGRT